MIRGTVIELGDRRWVLPPANVATMEFHAEFFKGAAKGEVDNANALDQLPVIADIVYRALKRNYPDVTPELVKEHVDLGNMEELMGALFKSSGLTRTLPQEDPAGE